MPRQEIIYPGSFDPPTNGHIDLIRRAGERFDHVIVAVLRHDGKEALFSVEERLEMLAESVAGLPNVSVDSFDGLLVDYARRRKAAKRGGGVIYATLGDAAEPVDASADDLLALSDALDQLDPRQRQVIECRFFGGMEEKEIAEALGVSERTVRRDWVKARAWLHRALYRTPPA